MCLRLKAQVPVTKYSRVRITMAHISGSVSFTSKPLISTLFMASTANVGDKIWFSFTVYSPMVNSSPPLMGKAAPVKNISRKRGKVPMIATSFTERHMAATRRLKLTMEKAVSSEISRMKPRVPGSSV